MALGACSMLDDDGAGVGVLPNPNVAVADLTRVPNVSFVPLDGPSARSSRGEIVLLTESPNGVSLGASGAVVARDAASGELFAFDWRASRLDNTLERPANTSAASASTVRSCPAVPKTFLNAHTCVADRMMAGFCSLGRPVRYREPSSTDLCVSCGPPGASSASPLASRRATRTPK